MIQHRHTLYACRRARPETESDSGQPMPPVKRNHHARLGKEAGMDATMVAMMNARRQRTRPLRMLFRLLASWLRRWRIRRDTRHGLAELDDWLLRDVGITRQQRDAECAKWFWQK
jgi:uncharacterized protein YjiS (DUF1127 family)